MSRFEVEYEIEMEPRLNILTWRSMDCAGILKEIGKAAPEVVYCNIEVAPDIIGTGPRSGRIWLPRA